MTTPPTPAPNLTPQELDHYRSLTDLYQACGDAIDAPTTPPDARENDLIPMLDAVAQELTDMNALALHRDTFDLAAEKQKLDPSIQQIQTLRSDLQRYVNETNTLLTVVGIADKVLTTGELLGLDV